MVLDQLHQELPGAPIVVAEYGIGTDDDAVRTKYVAQGLEIVHDAIARGIDVRGLFHWTAVDNYEWLHGYDVSFGLIDRDRTVRPAHECSPRRRPPHRRLADRAVQPGEGFGHPRCCPGDFSQAKEAFG